MSYADKEYYKDVYKGNTISESDIENALNTASIHIDSLTYNRIVALDFEKLTPFQKEKVQRVCCELAEWEQANGEAISSALSSYSINGVSMAFSKGFNVKTINGVLIPNQIYSQLSQTGLCSGVIR